jgi:hypothetical protein
MKSAALRKLEALKEDSEPLEPEPDFTGWTRREIAEWQTARVARMTHKDHVAAVREAAQSPPSQEPPTTREQFDAEDARDTAILAEREAKAATERAARDPDDEAARKAAFEKREAADKAVRPAEDAERLAEEAKLRPPPVENPDAPGPGAAPAAVKAAPESREQPAPQPEPEPKPKEWWEERAKWSPRRPMDEDERRGRPMYECTHEYDPLVSEEDYDPFE